MGKGGGRGAKSRVLCEVCGRRVRHGRVINVSIPGSIRKRLIHNDPTCKRKWEAEKQEIMSRWVEVRAHGRPKKAEGASVPKKRTREPFVYPPETVAWVRDRFKAEPKRRGGAIKKWLIALQQDNPTGVPNTDQPNLDYQDFYRFVTGIEAQLQWERKLPPAAAPVAEPPPAAPPMNPVQASGVVPSGESDIPELVEANIAIVRLLGKRRDGESLLAILTLMLGHIAEKPKLSE